MPIESTTLQEPSESESTGGGSSQRPTLFLVLECQRPLAGGARISLEGAERVLLGRGDDRRASRQEGEDGIDLRVPDAWMSRRHARLERALGRWLVRDLDSRNGTWINGERAQRAALSDGDVLEVGRTLFIYRESVFAPPDAPADADPEPASARGDGMTTLLPDMAAALRDLARIAPTGVEILIRGESGTGKELIARAAHTLSGRSGPFVAINCGALPETLIESELFGYERGAFSGANQAKAGLIRSAHGGTLFLDEIGDLAPASQTALLRALQEGEIVPVGATRPIAVDVRLIAATHRDLEERAREGAFREDLLGRIAGHVVRLPALRERREDLGVLLASLLPRIARDEPVPSLSPKAARLLLSYDWPRNIRQLEKYLAVAVPFAERGVVEASHLPAEVTTDAGRRDRAAGRNEDGGAARGSGRGAEGAGGRAASGPLRPEAEGGGAEGESSPRARKLSAREDKLRARLVELLREHRGNVSAVARAMQKGRTQIQRWIRRYDLDIDAFRDL